MGNLEGRYQYTEHDEFLFSSAKDQLAFWIEKMKENGIRKANIEIELVSLIKQKLAEE